MLVPSARPLAAAPHVDGGTLRFEFGSDPPGLNRLASNGTGDMRELYTYLGDQLARRHPEDPSLYGPELAVNITEADDGLTYVVHLRRGVLWHEPTVDWASGKYEWLKGPHELVSDDFVFALEIIQNPQVAGRAASLRNYFESLDHVEVIDDHTFALHFKEKLFSSRETYFELEPMPRWLYQYDENGKRFDDATWGLKLNEHWYNQRGIGTGPYRFVSWDLGARITMERNDAYFGERPAFAALKYTIVKDQVAWPRMLKTASSTSRASSPSSTRRSLQAMGPYLGNPHIKATTYQEGSYFYIGWNEDTPFFGDKLVRRAMTEALDRPTVLHKVFFDLGVLTTGPFPQRSPCYDKSIQPWPYDLADAGALLDQAGWTDSDGDGIRDKVVDGTKVPFAWTFLIYGSSTEWNSIVDIYREALMDIGVKMDPVAVEWSTMVKKMEDREFDAYSGRGDAREADLMQIWHSKEADRPKVVEPDRIPQPGRGSHRRALRREFDPDKRVESRHEFHALVHDLQPYTFIYQRSRVVLYWDYLNEPEFTPLQPNRNVLFWSFDQARP
jgi:ABC-type transport system substrate-binding protein